MAGIDDIQNDAPPPDAVSAPEEAADYVEVIALLAHHSGLPSETIERLLEREARLARVSKEDMARHMVTLLTRVRLAVQHGPPSPQERERLALIRRDIACQVLGLPLRTPLSRRDIREGFHRAVARFLGYERRESVLDYRPIAIEAAGEPGVRARRVLRTLEAARYRVAAHSRRTHGKPEWLLERCRAPLLRLPSAADVLAWHEELTRDDT